MNEYQIDQKHTRRYLKLYFVTIFVRITGIILMLNRKVTRSFLSCTFLKTLYFLKVNNVNKKTKEKITR